MNRNRVRQSLSTVAVHWLMAAALLPSSCGGDSETPQAEPAPADGKEAKAAEDVAIEPEQLAVQPVVEAVTCQDAPTSITVAPCLPAEVAGGAGSASLEQAAIFAWQEFIALNWPAVAQTGAPNTRGVPITDYVDGQPYHNTYSNGGQYDMGGCMGCHGVVQLEGGGFSFAFDGISKGSSNRPDAPEGPESLALFSQAFDARWLRRAK